MFGYKSETKKEWKLKEIRSDLPVWISVIKSWNMLSWKGPVWVIQSSSRPCAGHYKSHSMCLRALSKRFLGSASLGAVTAALGCLGKGLYWVT